ncbi:MAG: glycosyltransferase family 39 protein [Terracidiphilus sp.]
MKTRWMWAVVALLLAVQATQMILVVRRESLTFDEDNHMFSGYMMWHTGDYGLNPEHPPLVKLLATLPLLGRDLWVPKLEGRDFKEESYLDGRDWLARNDGASQHLVFEMRMMTGLLSLALSLLVFFAAREWFGDEAGLVALVLVSFAPNVLAHSALVTTDVGVSLGFLAGIYSFYRYVKQPTLMRLAVAGLAGGLLLTAKHSGILFAPMMVLLIGWEVATAEKGTRGRVALRLTGVFAAIVLMGVAVLWAFYGFRYAARPAGLTLNPSLADYLKPLSPFNVAVMTGFAHWHLLPESYLMGLVDVKLMAAFYPTFAFGKVYAHAVWWYFPAVILIKTTLGLLGLVTLAGFAIVTGALRKGREVAYLLLPWVFYLAVAVAAGMDIGARHILPVDVLSYILAAGGITALAARNHKWVWVGVVLVAAHVASALSVYPNYLAYANRAWGGPKNVHNLLSDANVDWAQQLYQVKAWQDAHPSQQCWFAYFAYPEVDPAVYGIHCQHLPTVDMMWQGGADAIPPVVEGNVYISAGDLSGCEWPSMTLNPYRTFQSRKPEALIDDSVMVYQGPLAMNQAAALSRTILAQRLMGAGKKNEALAMAREAVAMDPTEIMSQTTLGDIAAATGNKDEARKAWQAALAAAKQIEPDAQPLYVPDLEKKLATL